jgi:hypothetical protein
VGSTTFLPSLWEKVRGRAIAPRWIGDLDETYELRREFIVGASMMGFELVDLDDQDAVDALRAMDPPRDPIYPQQLLMVDAINAGNRRVVVEVPRRASKTTTILCLLLGRCACRPRYKVTFSAQTGSAGTAALEEWVRDGLDRIAPPEDEDVPPWLRGRTTKPKAQLRQESLFGGDLFPAGHQVKAGRGFRTRIGNARPGVLFDNGSSFMILKPEHSAYRGKAADVSWLDEAQEIDPLEGDALLAGILPLQDTRPGSQIIISGTAGEIKIGPFWTFLERLRTGNPSTGGIDYAADPSLEWADVEDETTALGILVDVHPGVNTLTTMPDMIENYRDMPRPQWAREYLSLWPETAGSVVIPSELWAAGLRVKRPARPARVAFGMAIKPGGSVACIAAAWRNSRGVAHVEIVAHQSGTAWLGKRGQELTRTYRGSTIAYDDISEGKATATEMQLLTPKPRLKVQTYTETAAGCVQIMRDLHRGKIVHFGQPALDSAVAIAARREVRNDRGLWLWTIRDAGDDITALDAATKALRNWDQHYATRATSSTPIMGA